MRLTVSTLQARQARSAWREEGDTVNHLPELFSASDRLYYLHDAILTCIAQGDCIAAGNLSKLLLRRVREYAPAIEATRRAREFGAVTLLDRIYSDNVS